MSTIQSSSRKEVLQLRLSAEERALLDALAAETGLSRAAIIRLGMRGQLEGIRRRIALEAAGEADLADVS